MKNIECVSGGSKMFISYTTKYTKLKSGYMGQLIEWPEVITEGKNLEDCRFMLRDVLQEMVIAYKELKMEIPQAKYSLSLEYDGV